MSCFGRKFQVFLLFHETLYFDKFKSSDFKYDNRFFKISARDNQIRQFWPHN